MILLVWIFTCASGFVLFSAPRLYYSKSGDRTAGSNRRISVIIPARNEEKNLPFLMNSFKSQTLVPDEIIVVDDFSTDLTHQIALEYDVTLIQNSFLPEGWTGKT